jgi:hypothetical protein
MAFLKVLYFSSIFIAENITLDKTIILDINQKKLDLVNIKFSSHLRDKKNIKNPKTEK